MIRNRMITSIICGIIMYGCNEVTNSDIQGIDILTTPKEVRREVVFDSFMNPTAFKWYHNNILIFNREIDKTYPTAFSYEFHSENIDTSLLTLPKIQTSKDLEGSNIMTITYDTYPLLFMGISFKPAHLKQESYYDRNQEVLWFDSTASSVIVTFKFKDQNGATLKEISDINVDFLTPSANENRN